MLLGEFTYGLPGISDIRENFEAQVTWGRFERIEFFPILLDGSARDAQNSPTDILRPGLLLGKISASGKYKEWDYTQAAVDGTQEIAAVLLYEQKMQSGGANADRWLGYAMVAGNVKANGLLIPNNANYGISGSAYEYVIRAQMNKHFLFDDRHQGSSIGGWKNIVAKTSSYTVLEAENNTLFTTLGAAGAVTFTLPTPKLGLRYMFFNAADQNMIIAGAAADQIIGMNNLSSDSLTFSTPSEKVGAGVELIGISGSKWIALVHLGTETQTPTVAA